MQYFEYTVTEGATKYPKNDAVPNAVITTANLATTFGADMWDVKWEYGMPSGATVVSGAVTGYSKWFNK